MHNHCHTPRRPLTHAASRLAALLSALAWLAVLSGPASALAATPQDAQQSSRPKIGLVLAGGGAKGAAHVGVLKVLEEMRIPIDVVAGTSMGSIVGGLYASGMSPEAIEREIQQIDWEDIFIDSPRREDLSFRRKSDDRLYMFKARPGFNDGKITVPRGYVHGQKFDLQLNRLTQAVAHIHDFDRLPIPYRAVAADLETGKEVVLKAGSLPRAIRASMAVPGAFDPVEIDGRILVDGGIVNNVPVSVARAMGADVVIVSDLGSDLYTRDQITSGLEVAGQLINFLFALNSLEQLKSLGARDVLISVKLGDIGAGNFDRITQAIPLGEQAARNAAESLARYSLSELDYRQHRAQRLKPESGEPVMHFVKVNNQSKVADEVITSQITVKPGAPLDVKKLEKDIQQIYGLDIFESVRYDLVEADGKKGLLLHVKEKSWGPGYLQAGLITSSNFEGDVTFRMGLTYTLTQINTLNGEWRIGAQVGDEPAIFTEIFQPFDPAARYFGFGHIGFAARNNNAYNASGDQIAEYRSRYSELELGTGRQFGTWGELRLGYRRQHGTTEVGIGAPAPDYTFNTGQIFVRMSDDKLDNLHFPTTGHFVIAEWRVSLQELGADSDFDQLRLNYIHAYSWGRNTLVGGLSLNTTLDDNAPVESLYRLGGFLQLSGFGPNQLTGQHAGLGRVIYMRRINDIQLAKAYVGASLELGNTWQDSSDISLDSTIFAGSAFVGVDTPIGPLYLGYGYNDSDESSVYLFLGPLLSF